MQWLWVPFEGLNVHQLYELLRLRSRVFVVEQRCAYLDLDGVDGGCVHGLGLDDGKLVASARLVPPGLTFEEPSIGRVVSAPEVRRHGHGRALMDEALRQMARRYPGQPIRIGAQRYLERFYSSFGFVVASEPYDEDGIPHVEMLRAGSPSAPE